LNVAVPLEKFFYGDAERVNPEIFLNVQFWSFEENCVASMRWILKGRSIGSTDA